VRRNNFPSEQIPQWFLLPLENLSASKSPGAAQSTEAAIFEGRHFKVIEAKRHTLADLIDRYIADILPHKGASSIKKQTQQLLWWKAHLGYCLLADITPALLAEHRDTLARGENIPRSNATVNLYLAALSHVCSSMQRCDA
jgi:hypothetical protein